jgi:hypothetical protein
MSNLLEHLLRLRLDIEAQIEGLESGQVKVLRLYNGGSSDEDCSEEHLAILYSHRSEIDAILRENWARSSLRFEPAASGAISRMADSSSWLPSD